MFQSYNFNQPANDSQNYYFYEEGFSKEELLKISQGVETIDYQKATTAGGSEQVRSSQVKWVHQTPEWYWLYEKLSNMAVTANQTLWNFDLFHIPEAIQYTEYLATNNGKYDWHQDIGPGCYLNVKFLLQSNYQNLMNMKVVIYNYLQVETQKIILHQLLVKQVVFSFSLRILCIE
jgi:hypothetical protein